MRIAVELDPPACNAAGDGLAFLQGGALALASAGADCITMADNPRALPRGDSVALACLVHALTGVSVVPHIACRDRNPLSVRSALTALDMAGLHEVLVVTGDPQRRGDKALMGRGPQLCAADLARLIDAWNGDTEGFSRAFRVSAAINCNAVNFDAELRRAERKISCGVSRLYTQPVLSEEGSANVEKARRSLGCELYGGILPVVGYKNAVFLSEGIRGISVGRDVREQYRGLDRDASSALAVSLSLQFARALETALDGYYVITPFRRLDIVTEIVRGLRAGERRGCLCPRDSVSVPCSAFAV